MIAEIIAAIGVITVLLGLTLLAVMKERLSRSLATLRHVRSRYTKPLAQLGLHWQQFSRH